MKTKKEKQERKKSFLSNMKWLLGVIWENHPGLIIASIILIPVGVGLNWLAVWRPAVIVDSLEAGSTAGTILLIVFGITGAWLLLDLVQFSVGYYERYCKTLLQLLFATLEAEKNVDLDYGQIIDPKVKELKNHGSVSADNSVFSIINTLTGIFTDVFKIVIFGIVAGKLHPLVAMLLVFPSLVTFLYESAQKKYEDKRGKEEGERIENRMWYFSWWLHGAKTFKDILLYEMRPWLTKRTKEAIRDNREFKKDNRRHGLIPITSKHIVTFLRSGIAYAYLIWRASEGEVTPGQFVLYFGIITEFTGIYDDLFWRLSELHHVDIKIGNLRVFLDLPSRFNRGNGLPVPTAAPSIEFRHVTFTYPEAEKPTVRDMNFRIEAGENIAIVGLNGAGKTTVIKLLCGLFAPTEGEILVNGSPISAYNRDEYYSTITAVFQTFSPLPLTIKQNITGTGNTIGTVNEDLYRKAVEYADLDEYFSRLERGGDTFLVKYAHESAAEPSGGEMQKILLARAFYHDRPLLILDEPTAALDPIAESNMYERYAAFSADKTSVFISHRLASTRFCDRIFFIEDGTIVEVGSHAELIRSGGRYAELFEVQSRYYQERPEGEPGGDLGESEKGGEKNG